jgi:hypothetical protein
MWKYLLIGTLLLQGANAQPAKHKAQSQQQGSASSVSPTPLNDRKIEAGDKSDSTGNSQQPKQDDEGKTFQRTQITQYWVLVITSVVTTALFVAYTFFCGLQWWQIKKQANLSAQQIQTMKDTLDEMGRQRKTLHTQAEGVFRQARYTRETVTESRKMVEKMQAQLEAIQRQEKHLATQADAARKAVELAETSEAPYFGIIGIRVIDFAPGYYTGVDITFFNGGKTPAWHFFPLAHFIVGEHPDYPEAKHSLELITTDIASTFFATENSHVFEFRQRKFALTEDIVSEKKGLFLIVTVDYLERGGVSKGYIRQNFICLWEKGKFCDWLPADNSPQYSKAD